MIRRYFAFALLVLIYVFYTIPITAAQSLVSSENLLALPALNEWLDSAGLSADLISGLVAALILALCKTCVLLNGFYR